MLTVSHNYLTVDELNSLREYVFTVGEKLYAPDAEYKNDEILAYNITCTNPIGYRNLIALYPGFKPFLEKIVDPECNVLHFVSLKMLLGAAIEEHQDDGLDEHLASPIKILPAHTHVFYLQIPSNLIGGVLYARSKKLLEMVKPVENTIVKMSGDTWHGVSEVTQANTERCMLVCEQYKLSKRNLLKLEGYDEPKILKG